MIRDLLRRAFIENAPLKGVAMILAITLFILVRGDKDTERSVHVALAIVRPEGRVLLANPPDEVEVTLRGPWTRIKRLNPKDVDPIVLDLSKVDDGDIVLDSTMVHIPAGLRVASIKPARFAVAFEHVKKLPVVPEPAGAPAEGYIVSKITADPSAVSVRGVKAVLDGLHDLRTLPVPVATKRMTFRAQVGLAPLPKGAEAEEDLIEVEVSIVEEAAARTLGAVTVITRPPVGVPKPPNLEVIPSKVEIVLRGGAAAIRQVQADEVKAVVELHPEDLGAKQRRARVTVEGLPEGVAAEVHPKEVVLVPK
jgi:YbbR domain-containing protein